MLFQEYLDRDIERVNEQLGVLKEQISQSFELNNFIGITDRRDQFLNERAREFRRTSAEQANRAQECLSKLGGKVKDRNGHDVSGYCIFFLVSLQLLQTEIEEFEAYLLGVQPASLLKTGDQNKPQAPTHSGNPLRTTIAWMKNTLMPRLERILRGAWQIIANLLNPTKVSLKGDARTGVFGHANVGLEIIFESEEKSPFSAIELPARFPPGKTTAVLAGEGE